MQQMFKVMDSKVLVTLKDDKVMAVALMIAEKQILAVCTRQVCPILAADLDGWCCRMLSVCKLNAKFLKTLIYLWLTNHD